jgi:hypothetical protein
VAEDQLSPTDFFTSLFSFLTSKKGLWMRPPLWVNLLLSVLCKCWRDTLLTSQLAQYCDFQQEISQPYQNKIMTVFTALTLLVSYTGASKYSKTSLLRYCFIWNLHLMITCSNFALCRICQQETLLLLFWKLTILLIVS